MPTIRKVYLSRVNRCPVEARLTKDVGLGRVPVPETVRGTAGGFGDVLAAEVVAFAVVVGARVIVEEEGFEVVDPIDEVAQEGAEKPAQDPNAVGVVSYHW